jgi:hypothetical protein
MSPILGVVAAVCKLAFAVTPYFALRKSANWLIHLGPLADRVACTDNAELVSSINTTIGHTQ